MSIAVPSGVILKSHVFHDVTTTWCETGGTKITVRYLHRPTVTSLQIKLGHRESIISTVHQRANEHGAELESVRPFNRSKTILRTSCALSSSGKIGKLACAVDTMHVEEPVLIVQTSFTVDKKP